MTIARGLALLAILVPCAAACRQTPQAKAEQRQALEATRKQELARRIAVADAQPTNAAPLAMWLMPPELREISGLALTPDGLVLAHDDNVARVYALDPKTGIVIKSFSLDGAPRGDFEAITIAGTDIYLLQSKGKLFKFKEGADGQEVPYSVFDTGLGKECEFESMTFEPEGSQLLLACKRFLGRKPPHELLIYRVPMPLGGSSKISSLAIPISDVVGSTGWKNFHPSDMAVDPSTGNYVIIASREKGLVVVTPDGEVVRSEPLPGDHNQAEGVAITRDSILIVSDEATHKPAAVTLYRWRP